MPGHDVLHVHVRSPRRQLLWVVGVQQHIVTGSHQFWLTVLLARDDGCHLLQWLGIAKAALLFLMNGDMCRMADPTFDPYRGCGTVVGGASRRCMRQKLRNISSLKLQTSDCESISFRIESSSLSSPADPLRSFQCEAQA